MSKQKDIYETVDTSGDLKTLEVEKKTKDVKKEKQSPYQILNNWLYDQSLSTPIPKSLEQDKAIGPQYILYFFQTSPALSIINDMFNNYYIYTMDHIEIFKFIKRFILKFNFKPRYLKQKKKINEKLYKWVSKKYPFLKQYEVIKIVKHIENDKELKDNIYEMAGFKKPSKKKTTKQTKTELENLQVKEESVSFDDYLNNFV